MKLIHLNTDFRPVAVNPETIVCVYPSGTGGTDIYFVGADHNYIEVTQKYTFVLSLIEQA